MRWVWTWSGGGGGGGGGGSGGAVWLTGVPGERLSLD